MSGSRDDAPRVWLVDGFNVLHALLEGRERGEWWRAEARQQLLERVRRFAPEGRAASPGEREVWVVFDGDRPAETDPPGPVRTVFAPSADEWLVRRWKEHPRRDDVAVVTRDRRLASRLRHHGARVVDPREFLAACRDGDRDAEPGANRNAEPDPA